MKFIENYQDRQWAALALSPEERDELKKRLESGNDDIEIEDMFDDDQYKIERIRIVTDWSEFKNESEEIDTNVKWSTRAFWAVIFFALIGVYSVIKYVT
ncbi:MAG: hypothetical protein ABW139_20740 [Candidatus Thiodiazotropha sp. DIVDIV]